jgi:hypothetical protein
MESDASKLRVYKDKDAYVNLVGGEGGAIPPLQRSQLGWSDWGLRVRIHAGNALHETWKTRTPRGTMHHFTKLPLVTLDNNRKEQLTLDVRSRAALNAAYSADCSATRSLMLSPGLTKGDTMKAGKGKYLSAKVTLRQ